MAAVGQANVLLPDSLGGSFVSDDYTNSLASSDASKDEEYANALKNKAAFGPTQDGLPSMGVLITTNKLASLALSTNETGAWSATSALTATSSTQKGKERRATDQRRARKIRMTVPRQEPARAQALILSKVKMGNLHHTNFPFEFLHLHSGQMHTLNGSLQCSGALLCHSLLTCSNFNDVALAPVIALNLAIPPVMLGRSFCDKSVIGVWHRDDICFS